MYSIAIILLLISTLWTYYNNYEKTKLNQRHEQLIESEVKQIDEWHREMNHRFKLYDEFTEIYEIRLDLLKEITDRLQRH